MKVLKFGGSSLADAQCLLNASAIILDNMKQKADLTGKSTYKNHIAVVLSAPKGITNRLVSLADSLYKGSTLNSEVSDIVNHLNTIALQLAEQQKGFDQKKVLTGIRQIFDKMTEQLEGCSLIGLCPDEVRAHIISNGEIASIVLMEELLGLSKFSVGRIEPEKFLVTNGSLLDATANLEQCKLFFKQQYKELSDISLMPGFIGVDVSGRMSLLGRNGSDYSAAVLAACASVDHFEIWTDVNGIYNCDPNIIPEARPLRHLSYHEAIELSYFGAKVLHPKTVKPIAQHHIPCVIKNSLNIEDEGTKIDAKPSTQRVVKAISNLNEISMVNLSGPGMKGMVGMAARVFQTMSKENISLVLISQSSSEYSISFSIFSRDVEQAVLALQQEFEVELTNKVLQPIQVTNDLSVVSIIGDGMRKQRGVAARFFRSLTQANVNIVAIAQDSSERSVSAVVEQSKCVDAVTVCHQNFFSQKQTIDLFLIGCGVVGSELLNQIKKQQQFLEQQQTKLCVYGIANSKGMVLNPKGIDLNGWREKISDPKDAFSIATIHQFIQDNHLINPVIVDCTSDQGIADNYLSYLNHGLHVVTPNKKANTREMAYYQELRQTAIKTNRQFLYETNVGAGLPVIDTFKGLMNAGDQLIKLEGILSGSLSYIFGKIEEGMSLSQATYIARDSGFTEPDPRDDLSGMDVARKILIMAREAGMAIEMEDIEIESVLPKDFDANGSIDEFLENLKKLDSAFEASAKTAKNSDAVLRYIGQISDGKGKVTITSLPKDTPLAGVKDGENAIAIHSHYYQPIPLVLRGYGAGAEVTAAGVFGDVMRTLAWKKEF